MCMATKTVSLSEEAYDRLKKWKKNDDESFSNVILRVMPQFRTAEEISEHLKKSKKHLTDEEAEKMKKDIE